MAVQVKEKTKEEIEKKLNSIDTDLSKIVYLESALKSDSIFEVKRFIFGQLITLYENRGMYGKAARAASAKAGIDIAFKNKIESYLRAGELYSKAGKVGDSEEMFVRASRNANIEQMSRIKLARKNIFFISALELEKKGKKASAMKFYEQLIKMELDELEKQEVKQKLIGTYKSLGKFREAELLEGI